MNERTQASLLLALTVLYVLSPIDFLPDMLPIVGNGDDLLAMWLGMNQFIRSRMTA